MHIPSEEETTLYFSSLGYLVSPVRLRSGWIGWKITGPTCPLDGRIFNTRLALWAEWLDYAAERIHESSLVESIMETIRAAPPERQAALATEIIQWRDGAESSVFSSLTTQAPAASTDGLPVDWKARIATLVDQPGQRLSFWFAIERALLDAKIKVV